MKKYVSVGVELLSHEATVCLAFGEASGLSQRAALDVPTRAR